MPCYSGTPQIDGGAIDNCHLVVTSYEGVIITNMHFNTVSKLVFAPPTKPPSNITTQLDRCQYWKGAMCSVLVVGNTFTCGGPETKDFGPASCGVIDVQ
jgi:hypothetical protein